MMTPHYGHGLGSPSISVGGARPAQLGWSAQCPLSSVWWLSSGEPTEKSMRSIKELYIWAKVTIKELKIRAAVYMCSAIMLETHEVAGKMVLPLHHKGLNTGLISAHTAKLWFWWCSRVHLHQFSEHWALTPPPPLHTATLWVLTLVAITPVLSGWSGTRP